MVFGLWWWWNTYAFVSWLSLPVILTGAALIWTGVERLRFRQGGGGTGVVEIDERRLSYFGPLTGGVIAMDDVTRLVLDPTGRPAHWVLSGVGGQSLSIPVDAEGAEVAGLQQCVTDGFGARAQGIGEAEAVVVVDAARALESAA
jgi:hypothetical protein